MYIRGLISRTSTEMAEISPIVRRSCTSIESDKTASYILDENEEIIVRDLDL